MEPTCGDLMYIGVCLGYIVYVWTPTDAPSANFGSCQGEEGDLPRKITAIQAAAIIVQGS
jgi:hypothetical protein